MRPGTPNILYSEDIHTQSTLAALLKGMTVSTCLTAFLAELHCFPNTALAFNRASVGAGHRQADMAPPVELQSQTKVCLHNAFFTAEACGLF